MRLRASPSPRLRLAAQLAATGLAYCATALAGLQLSPVGGPVTPLWPPTGVAVVALLAFGYRVWPALTVAALAVNIPEAPSLAAAAWIAVGNTTAPVVAAALLSRVSFRPALERVRDVFALVLIALPSMAISATIGATALLSSGAVSPEGFAEIWAVWWTGDAMGVLLVAPFLWSIGALRPKRLRWPRLGEGLAVWTALLVAAAVGVITDFELLFVTLPVLGWIAWRFQLAAAAPAALAASAIATWGAVHSMGTFAGETVLTRMMVLQGYNATVALTALFFAAAVAGRIRASQELQRSAEQMEDAVRRRTAELTVANERLVQEVAERRQAQRELQQRELQLADAQAIAQMGSWEWDIRSDRLRWSDELHRIYGIDRTVFAASFDGFLQLVHPEDRTLVRQTVERAAAGGGSFSFEHRIVRPDGGERTLHGRGTVVADAAGTPLRMVGTGQDITERSIVDRALRESEQRFRTVFESAAIGMAQCDQSGRIIKANAALEKMMGCGERDLSGRTLLDLTHPEDRPRSSDLLSRLLADQLSSFDVEKRLVRSDGRELWVQSSVSLTRDAAGTARFVHVIVQDVTERRQAEALQRADAERARLRELFAEVPAVVLVARGPEHIIEFTNDAFDRVFGDRPRVGMPLAEAVPELTAQGHEALIEQVRATGNPFAASEVPLSPQGGSGVPEERFFNVVYRPVRAPDGGVDGVLVHATDVSETVRGRHRVTESLAFLDTLLRTAPAGFAVFDHQLRYVRINERLAAMNGLGVEAHLGRELREVLPHLADVLEPPLRRALERREAVTDVELSPAGHPPPWDVHWLASCYPIADPAGEILGVGAVVVDITERKRFERLLSGQKEVLELVARGAEQPAVLAALARMAERLAGKGIRAAILLGGDNGARLRIGAAPSLAPELRSEIDGIAAEAAVGSCGAAAHARTPVVVSDIALDSRRGDLRDAALAAGLRASWSWPILGADGGLLGAFCLYCSDAREPTEQERELLDVLTHTAAIAIEREHAERERVLLVERERETQELLYRREHRIAETLQRSLLPESLPTTPGVEVAARYLPASADLEVGGDWYDIMPLPGGQLGLAIGDIAGHGISAAAGMGQIRMALRAYAMDHLAPAEALSRLNHLLLELQPGVMSTVLYCQFDPATGDLRFASAGHPPPLIVRADGRAEFAAGGLAPPLGVMHGIDYSEASTQIEAAATLLLYTDGLIERRGEAIDEGLARLDQAASGAPADLEAACDHIIQALLSGGAFDDVALLALRFVSFAGRPLKLHKPALPAAVPELRRVLRRWLADNGAADEEGHDILVAFAEAYTNAVQHAYGSADGAVDIEAATRDGEVVITVRDYGAWRSPAPDSESDGGRGLALMQGLMEAVDVASSVEGTEVRMRRRLKSLAGG